MEIYNLLRTAPAEQISPVAIEWMSDWNEETTALEVLKVTDDIVHSSLGSDFVVSVLETILAMKMKKENIEREDLIKLAPWRQEG